MILTPAHQKILDGVAANGVSTASYTPRHPNDPVEIFSYTIGLPKSLGWPELIVAGLAEDVSVALLGAVIERLMARAGPSDGLELANVIADRPVRLRFRRDLKPRHRALAQWYAGQAGYTLPDSLCQIVWPDDDGFFPDDPRCDADIAEVQALDAA